MTGMKDMLSPGGGTADVGVGVGHMRQADDDLGT